MIPCQEYFGFNRLLLEMGNLQDPDKWQMGMQSEVWGYFAPEALPAFLETSLLLSPSPGWTGGDTEAEMAACSLSSIS